MKTKSIKSIKKALAILCAMVLFFSYAATPVRIVRTDAAETPFSIDFTTGAGISNSAIKENSNFAHKSDPEGVAMGDGLGGLAGYMIIDVGRLIGKIELQIVAADWMCGEDRMGGAVLGADGVFSFAVSNNIDGVFLPVAFDRASATVRNEGADLVKTGLYGPVNALAFDITVNVNMPGANYLMVKRSANAGDYEWCAGAMRHLKVYTADAINGEAPDTITVSSTATTIISGDSVTLSASVTGEDAIPFVDFYAYTDSALTTPADAEISRGILTYEHSESTNQKLYVVGKVGTTVSDPVEITVTPPPATPDSVAITTWQTEMLVGETAQMTKTYAPTNVLNKEIAWSVWGHETNNTATSKATINAETGVLTTLTAGEVWVDLTVGTTKAAARKHITITEQKLLLADDCSEATKLELLSEIAKSDEDGTTELIRWDYEFDGGGFQRIPEVLEHSAVPPYVQYNVLGDLDYFKIIATSHSDPLWKYDWSGLIVNDTTVGTVIDLNSTAYSAPIMYFMAAEDDGGEPGEFELVEIKATDLGVSANGGDYRQLLFEPDTRFLSETKEYRYFRIYFVGQANFNGETYEFFNTYNPVVTSVRLYADKDAVVGLGAINAQWANSTNTAVKGTDYVADIKTILTDAPVAPVALDGLAAKGISYTLTPTGENAALVQVADGNKIRITDAFDGTAGKSVTFKLTLSETTGAGNNFATVVYEDIMELNLKTPVSTVTVSANAKTGTVYHLTGSTYLPLSVAINPDNATIKSVTWTLVSGPTGASASNNIHATNGFRSMSTEGTFVIKATVDGVASNELTIIVRSTMPVTVVSAAEDAIKTGVETQLSVMFDGAAATSGITYIVTKDGEATTYAAVSAEGKFSATAAGEYSIKAVVNGFESAAITITVTKASKGGCAKGSAGILVLTSAMMLFVIKVKRYI